MIRATGKNGTYEVEAFGTRREFTDPIEALEWTAHVANLPVEEQVKAHIRTRDDRLRRQVLADAIHREVAIWLHNLQEATTLQNPMPADPGPMVYIARNIKHAPIYIGATRNLYRRLAAHGQGSAWWDDAHDIAIIPVKSWRKALDLEARLIAEHQPTGNKAGVFTATIVEVA